MIAIVGFILWWTSRNGNNPSPGPAVAGGDATSAPRAGGVEVSEPESSGSTDPEASTESEPEKPSVLAEMFASDNWEWTAPVNLGPLINGPQWDADPILSGDDLTLTFKSYRDGGAGLWMSRRSSSDQPWGTPTSIPLVTALDPARGNLTANGRTITFSAGEKIGERYKSDLFEAHWLEDVWSEPEMLSISHPAYESGPYVTRNGTVSGFSSRSVPVRWASATSGSVSGLVWTIRGRLP